MLNNILLDEIYKKMQERVEKNTQKEYHERIKKIKVQDSEERNNIKMSIISELYYKQGFRDGIDFIIKNINKQK